MANPPVPVEAAAGPTRGRKFHWLEKLQVQLASAVALGIVYFGLYRYFRPWDPDAAIAFLPYGSFAQLALLAGVVWGLAAVAALLTTHSRPEGAMVAALIGASGFALRSPPMRTLLWQQPDGYRGLFLQLVGETALLAVVMLVAVAIIAGVRRAIAAVKPEWVWQNPMAGASPASKQPGGEGRRTAGSSTGRFVSDSACCMGLGLVVSVVLVLVLLRSPDRGQVIFSLLAANLLGVLVAHQVFPARTTVAAWLAPMLVGMAFYVLAAVSSIHSGPNAWASVDLTATALPIDWMTAGAGGGVLGYWISERIHELKHFENQEKGNS